MNIKTKRILYISIFIVVCAIAIYVGDFVLRDQHIYIANILVGIITIGGGALLAYLWIDHERIKRERENLKREIEKKQRIIRSLRMFKNFLLPWIFNLATTLSDHFLLYDQNRLSNNAYHADIPELEDIFRISYFDKDGRQIRGTKNMNTVDAEICKLAIDMNRIRSTLTFGLDSLRHLEERFREFPELLDLVDEDVSKVVHLPIYLRERVDELQRWEYERSRKKLDVNFLDESGASDCLRTNLRIAGATALNIVLAIDLNIKILEQEIQNWSF